MLYQLKMKKHGALSFCRELICLSGLGSCFLKERRRGARGVSLSSSSFPLPFPLVSFPLPFPFFFGGDFTGVSAVSTSDGWGRRVLPWRDVGSARSSTGGFWDLALAAVFLLPWDFDSSISSGEALAKISAKQTKNKSEDNTCWVITFMFLADKWLLAFQLQQSPEGMLISCSWRI